MSEKFKEFKPTSWAINNKTSIYVLTLMLVLFGWMSYKALPKEQFPDLVIPTFIVSTIYPGTSPTDIENLVTRYLEKNLKGESDVKKITSKSMQDVSMINVEFNTGVDPVEAKQRVKNAVDKAKKDLPNDLPNDPQVIEISFSEFPIIYINLSSEEENLVQLKKYADDAKDKIESLPAVNRVDVIGALDREIQINVDLYKMNAAGITFSNIEQAVAFENMTVASGTLKMNGMERSMRVVGEFADASTIENLVVSSSNGAQVTIKDIASVEDSYAEQDSFARLDGGNVVTLNVVKRSGANLLETIDNVKGIIADLKRGTFPKSINVTFTGDQSRYTRATLDELNNTILIGFILVTIVLTFFMGLVNAIFVGVAVPLSMCLAYLTLPIIGFSMNMLVMFSFIFALGIVVDDAIVVIENTHRIFNKHKGKMPIAEAAKRAAGEVFVPILSGTMTTIAPFVPLCFWPGMVGEFMVFLPVTIIITLTASLLVAYIINPVFAVQFMSHEEDKGEKLVGAKLRKVLKNTLLFALVSAPFYLAGSVLWGNVVVFLALTYLFYNAYGRIIIHHFQVSFLPALMRFYERVLRWTINGRRPMWLFASLIGLLVVVIVAVGIVKPQVVFFPDNEPNTILVYTQLPEGTDILVTDSITRELERRVAQVVGKDNPDVESLIANVALNASESSFDGGTKVGNKSKISVNFREVGERTGEPTSSYLPKIRDAVQGVPGAIIKVDKNKMGPPTGKPINMEIRGENLDELVTAAQGLKAYIVDSLQIPGIEKLEMDFETSKPELVVKIDRLRANYNGMSSGNIGATMRNALYGKEVSKYRDGEDQYPIMVRLKKEQREDIDALIELPITYRDMASGTFRQIPLSSVVDLDYVNSYGSITRINEQRVITLSSNVLNGYNANVIISQIERALPAYELPKGVTVGFTGEQEDQQESAGFLGGAMMAALFIIFFILITQFNSLTKPFVILSEVIFSLIGVLIGFMATGMPISIIMTGLGVVALAGIVIRNGILLVEFTDVLMGEGMPLKEAIVQAGKTRIIPVVLTAVSTILGLIPLAIGMNIDFAGLFESFSPHIYFGGDNTAFFGPLAWAIVFGLTFATFLTLVFIPVMYYIAHQGTLKVKRVFSKR